MINCNLTARVKADASGVDLTNVKVPMKPFGARILSKGVAAQDADTFDRPNFAGKVVKTMTSSDVKKVMTIRAIGYDALPELIEKL